MVLKKVMTAGILATLWACSGPAMADEYRPDEFLGLDLSRAALSPTPLGPPSKFVPVQIEASGDRDAVQAAAEPKAEPHIIIHKTRVAHLRVEKPRGAARARLARRHSNPLDAQAFDTRIQTWPCKSGGICNWRR